MSLAINEIIQAAYDQTERKADRGKLDLRLELFLGMQELLTTNRFWWTEKTATFSTVLGQAKYDLSSVADDYSEIIKMYNTTGYPNPTNIATQDGEILPILDRAQQISALETTTNQPPSMWMAEPGTWGTIRFQAPCDNVYPIRFIYQASLNVTLNDGDDTVPLVPPPLHYGLVICLKRRIFDYLYGQEDPRFIIANAQYERFVKDVSRRAHWSAQAMRTWTSGDAVQSHG